MKTIITIQHTQSVHHTNGMVGSRTDWELTELGLNQADNIGKSLARELAGKTPVLYSSDLVRARQTAEAVCAHLGVRPILRGEIRERNLGRCCGKSVAWLRANMEKREESVDDRLFSDAESRRDEWNRLKPFFDEVMESADENVIIVSHGDLLCAFNAMFAGQSVESLEAVELWGSAGGVSIMSVADGGKRRIRKLGDMSYIIG